MTSAVGRNRTEHRANYTLERGTWLATCRVCGFQVSDPVRQRAATLYREHIKEVKLLPSLPAAMAIDLTEELEVAP